MSEDKYSELKLLAGKATPGPWWVDSHGMNMTSLPNLDLVFSHPANGEAVRNAETGNLSHWRNDWDASYIATANPKTILELISDFDAQRLRADTAEAELKIVRKSRDDELENYNALISELAAAEQRITELSADNQQLRKLLEQTLAALNPTSKLSKSIRAALNQKSEGESHE